MARGKKPRAIMEEDTITFTEPKLPEDLVFAEILSKLPAKSLMQFKCVSKSWSTRISGDSSFIAAHLNHQSSTGKISVIIGQYKEEQQGRPVRNLSLLLDEFAEATDIDMSYVAKGAEVISFVGSCNGLVCLQLRRPSYDGTLRIVLWNPATRQFRFVAENGPEEPLLPPDLDEQLLQRPACYGFGFDEESKDYKIVKIVEPLLRAKVFSKRSGRWRWGGVEDQHGALSGLKGIWVRMNAVAADGALHWSGYYKGESGGRYHVLSFNLRDEVLQVADAPGGCRGYLALCKWKASLAAVMHTSTEERSLWMASSTTGDNNNKHGLCWIKVCKVNPTIMRDNVFIGVWGDRFVVQTYSREVFKLSLQDPTAIGQVRELKSPGPSLFFYDARDYVESLISVFG